jgi:hypothetical protein
MRKLRIAVVVGVVLALTAGATSAHALWAKSVAGPAVQVRSGDLGVTATWPNGAPTWGALVPGTSTASQTLRVTGTGSGTTLRWSVQVTGTIPEAARPYVTFGAWIGTCGTGTSVGNGSPAGGSYAPGQSVDVCVRASLAAGAPQSLAGTSLVTGITVTAVQRSS